VRLKTDKITTRHLYLYHKQDILMGEYIGTILKKNTVTDRIPEMCMVHTHHSDPSFWLNQVKCQLVSIIYLLNHTPLSFVSPPLSAQLLSS